MGAESTFLLKYVERHEREEQSDPWSIRQMGIYFQAKKPLGQNAFVLVNTSKRVQQRMKAASGSIFGAAEMHLLLLSTIMHGWRDFLDYLEHRLNAVVSHYYTRDNDGGCLPALHRTKRSSRR